MDTIKVPSDIMSVIASNNVFPSALQKQRIQDLIAEAEVDVAKIDGEIAQLNEKRRNRLDQIFAYHAALCPAQRLPHELVSDIFLLARESWKSSVSFSQICHAWREVAITNPRLWTSIELLDHGASCYHSIFFLNMCCKRSPPLPLSVTIHSLDESFNEPQFVQILTPYIDNIERLSLTLNGYQCFLSLSSIPCYSFSRLKYFEYSTFSYDREHAPSEGPEIISFASAERLLEFRYTGDLPVHTTIILPDQVVELCLHGLTAAQCVMAVDHTPKIAKLSCTVLEIGNPSLYSYFYRNPISRLQLLEINLAVDCRDDVHNGHILDCLTAPSLVSLHLEDRRSQSWPMSSFSSFIARSSCTPTRLSLVHTIISREGFIECIRTLPSLIELRLEKITCMGNIVLEQLIYRPGQVNVLPNLEVLDVTVGDSYPTCSVKLLIDVVMSRCWLDHEPNTSTDRPSRLRHCHADFETREESPDISEDVIARLDTLQANGLDVVVWVDHSAIRLYPKDT